MAKLKNKNNKSLIYLLQWLLIAVTAGITGSLMVALTYFLVSRSSRFILSTSIPFPFWTLAGALICGLFFYRLVPTASGDGIPSYINGVLERRGQYSFRETMAKLAATVTALMTLSAGGLLGPAGRVAAGLNSRIALLLSKTGLLGDHRRTASICGMAAAVGAIFHSPIGGGIFAVEVLQRANMQYNDLFPAVLSSSVAVYIYNFLPLGSPLHLAAPEGVFNSVLMPPILVTALLAALAARAYRALFVKLSRLFRKEANRMTVLKLIIGSISSSLLVFMYSPFMAGNIRGVIDSLLAGHILPVRNIFGSLPLPVLLLFSLIVVAAASSLAIASGISVGMTSPSVLIGLYVGAFAATLFGFTPGQPDYVILLVAGFSGVLSSTINVPIGAAVIAVESFGASYGFCAGVSSVIGFQVNRHHTLYDYALNYTD